MSKARGLADLGNVYNDGALSNRNILINGNLAVNQRGLSIASVATGAYGEDRWKKTAGGMTQIVEEANYLPSTEYTLSGTNVTTQQITSPASGNWTLPDIPVTARLVQLELGDTATPFEHRSFGEELRSCQRYYELGGMSAVSYAASGAAFQRETAYFNTTKRSTPTVTVSQTSGAASAGAVVGAFSLGNCFILGFSSTGASQEWVGTYTADAEL